MGLEALFLLRHEGRWVELGLATSGSTITYGWPSESTSGGSTIWTRMLAALGWALTKRLAWRVTPPLVSRLNVIWCRKFVSPL